MSHYYDKTQQSPLKEQKITVKGMIFFTSSALFSKDHLDQATKLLIEKCDLTGAKEVCDLGCGWGAISILVKKSNPDMNITAIDITDHAIRTMVKNAQYHKTEMEVIKSDVLQDTDKMFDVILTNPPYSAGRKVCYRFIEESFEHLHQGGSLQLVARHQKGGKMLGLHMEEIFGNCEHIAKSGGFRIYKSVKE